MIYSSIREVVIIFSIIDFALRYILDVICQNDAEAL